MSLMIPDPSPPLVLLWILQIKYLLTLVMITVNPPVNHSSKLIFLLYLCLLPTLDCFLDFDYERCFMYISKNSHTLNIYINEYYHVWTIMKYFYNICYIKVPNEHIDLKRKVCVILILP